MTPTLLLIAITSAGCPPCRALHADFGADPRIVQWIDAADPEARQYRVRAYPTVIAMRDGEEIGRHVGYRGREEMERWMRSMEDRAARQTLNDARVKRPRRIFYVSRVP